LFTIVKSQLHPRLNRPQNFPKSQTNKPTPSQSYHGTTLHSKKRREERKREHDVKDGKQPKLQENRKSEGKEQPDADKKTRGKS